MASSNGINSFNEQWRQSPLYEQGLRAVGEPVGGPITLDSRQRKQLLQWMQQHGVQTPKGAEIDPAGNANEDEGFSKHKKWIIPAAIGLGTLGLGAAGVGPLAGIMGAGGGQAANAAGIASMAGSGMSGGVAGGTAAALGSAPGLIGASSIPASLAMGAVPGIGSGAGAGMGIGGYLGGLGKQLGGDFAQRAIGSAGSALAGGSQAAANNRGVALDAEQQAALMRQRQQESFENQLIQRSQDDRESLTDAFTKSVQADRVANAKGYQPASLNLVPGQGPSALPNFGTGMAKPSDSLIQNAMSMNTQVQPRLTQGSQLPKLEQPNYYQNDPNLMHAGAGEKIGSWLGPALSFAGQYRNPYSGEKK
jgi:hypothetical protein